MQTLFPEAKAAIKASTITVTDEGASLVLPDQLDKDIYAQVKEVFARLGGKWKGNKDAHLFPYDR